MSLFDRIFGGRKKEEPQRVLPEYKALTAYEPAFTSFSGQLYETELIRSAINVRATHISKLKVDFYGHGSEALSKRLTRPNGFQTWSQFLYRVSTILDCNNGVIIAPVFDKFGRVTELYPVLPERTKMVDNGGYPWIAMKFRDGHFVQMPVWQVGLMTKFQYKDDFFGEKNNALHPTMKLIDIQEQGITEGVKSAAAIRFIAQMSNFAKAEDLAKEQRRFVENNLTGKNGGGMLLFPNTFQNIKQVDSKPYVPDADQMKVINESVYRYFNVNEEVLRGEAYGDKGRVLRKRGRAVRDPVQRGHEHHAPAERTAFGRRRCLRDREQAPVHEQRGETERIRAAARSWDPEHQRRQGDLEPCAGGGWGQENHPRRILRHKRKVK